MKNQGEGEQYSESLGSNTDGLHGFAKADPSG